MAFWDMNELGKMMVVFGILLVIVGAILWSGIGRSWIGRLPGDIRVSKGHFTFYFPVVTCILLSIILTILLRIFKR